MPKDMVVARFNVNLAITVTPVNKYGDEVGGGHFTYTATIEATKLSDAMRQIERVHEPEISP